MSKSLVLAAASAAMLAALSLAAAPAEAHHRHHHHHADVAIYVGKPHFFGYPRFYGNNYRPVGMFLPAGIYRYDYRDEPFCRQWAFVYSRSRHSKWRCIAW